MTVANSESNHTAALSLMDKFRHEGPVRCLRAVDRWRWAKEYNFSELTIVERIHAVCFIRGGVNVCYHWSIKYPLILMSIGP